jgi:hypothetical protein
MRPGARDSRASGGDPLTFGQEQLRLVEQMSSPETLVFPLRLPMRDGVSPSLVAAALTRIVRAHDALRMSVVPGAPESQVTAQVRSVQQLPAGADLRAYGVIGPSTAVGRTPFSFSIDEQSDPPRVVLHLHHVFVDGWSASLIAKDFYQHYAALTRGERAQPGAPAGSFGAYARELRQTMSGERLARHLAFWAGELRDAQPLELPYQFQPWHPGARMGRFPALTFEVPGCSMAGLEARARQVGGSGSAVILAAFAGALTDATGQRDLLLQAPLADRGTAGRRALVGSLVNLCVLRLRMPVRPDGDATIRAAASVLARAMRRQTGPFQQDGRHTGDGQILNRTPKVTVAFNQDIAGRLDPDLVLRSDLGGGRRSGPCLIWESEAGCISDLHLEMLASPPALPLRFRITYRADMWRPDGAEALGRDFAAGLLRLASADVPTHRTAMRSGTR